jgi:hypothetical protein
MFWNGIKITKQTELMEWGIRKVDILTNLLLFWLVFCLFWLFQNTETPCFDIKVKQPKQMSCSDSAETSFGSSFGCFDTKLVSEDTLPLTVELTTGGLALLVLAPSSQMNTIVL